MDDEICSFCDKVKAEVSYLVGRKNGSPMICDECIGLAVEILTKQFRRLRQDNKRLKVALEEKLLDHACMRETLRQISVEPCDPSKHADFSVCSPCHARSYFESVEGKSEKEDVPKPR